MTVTQRRIKEIRVEAVECPKQDIMTVNEMVRLNTCRECKYFAGEHGGAYIECLFDHSTLRMIEEKDEG